MSDHAIQPVRALLDAMLPETAATVIFALNAHVDRWHPTPAEYTSALSRVVDQLPVLPESTAPRDLAHSTFTPLDHYNSVVRKLQHLQPDAISAFAAEQLATLIANPPERMSRADYKLACLQEIDRLITFFKQSSH